MSDAARAESPRLVAAPIDQALQLAQPWPWDEPSALHGITDEEWDAFMRALAER
jgi:hypothetical protein